MAIRNIIEIDEELCNGCGKCVTACAEGAIQMVEGKAKLVSDVYCDGLGACIGDCPTGALEVVQREAAEFDEGAVEQRLEELKREEPKPHAHAGGCPGSAARSLASSGGCPGSAMRSVDPAGDEGGSAGPSQLVNWPVQLHLISPQAPYFQNAELLVAADCAPFAYPDFHRKLLAGRPLVIACPKLDEAQPYVDKLAQLIAMNDLKGISIVHMEVPCCTGLMHIVLKAKELSGIDVPIKRTVVGIRGDIIQEDEIT